VLVGTVPIDFPRAPLYDKELRFRVSRSYGPGRYDGEYEERGLDYPIGYVRWTERRNMEAVLQLQARGQVSFGDLVEVVPVHEAPAAYARLSGKADVPPRGALVLDYGGNGSTDGLAGEPIELAHPALPLDVATRRDGAVETTAAKTGTGRSPVRIGLIGPGGFAGRVLIPALEAAEATLLVVGGGAGPSASAAARNAPCNRGSRAYQLRINRSASAGLAKASAITSGSSSSATNSSRSTSGCCEPSAMRSSSAWSWAVSMGRCQ